MPEFRAEEAAGPARTGAAISRCVREEIVVVKSPAEEIVIDPVESAREAGLRYVSDDKPGIAPFALQEFEAFNCLTSRRPEPAPLAMPPPAGAANTPP
jgi:hypothetical protein